MLCSCPDVGILKFQKIQLYKGVLSTQFLKLIFLENSKKLKNSRKSKKNEKFEKI